MPGLVGQVEVTACKLAIRRLHVRSAVEGERGPSRSRPGGWTVFLAKAKTWPRHVLFLALCGAVHGKAVVTRWRRSGSDDPGSHNERAEGLLLTQEPDHLA